MSEGFADPAEVRRELSRPERLNRLAHEFLAFAG
jgi:hypothetical protein